MFIFWSVRYLNKQDEQFHDRNLYLDSTTLDPVSKAAVELCYAINERGYGRGMLRFRQLFKEQHHTPMELQNLVERHGHMNGFTVIDYFEDEAGNDISGALITLRHGEEHVRVRLPGPLKSRQTNEASTRSAFAGANVSVTPHQLTTLGYFARDLRELMASALMKEGPGSLVHNGAGTSVKTAVTAEEIRAFTMVFRRLYMCSEPANLLNAAAVFQDVWRGNPLAEWVKHCSDSYSHLLQTAPDMASGTMANGQAFTRKFLIDVFLNTQYAHQPDKRRSRQFRACLKHVDDSEPKLVWLFLTSIWQCSITLGNAGRIIADFYDDYCLCHAPADDVVVSALTAATGIGALEKKNNRRDRLLRETSEELSMALWQKDGRPHGGPAMFMREAEQQLRALVGFGDVSTQ